MPLQNHLIELERKHSRLEKEIESALNHPSTDDLKILALKKRKLRLKDEIYKHLNSSENPTHH